MGFGVIGTGIHLVPPSYSVSNLILGIETSCDETSAAVVAPEGPDRLRSLVILSQDVHQIFGGVVPELASRAHIRAIDRVVGHAMGEAGVEPADLGGIAVTRGPGLIGALLVGFMYGKALAYRYRLPWIGVNHLEGHLFAPTLEIDGLSPPFVALLVSGGHTMLLDVSAWGAYRLMGATRDDAAGEAFDKVGTLLGLGYPAGAAVERLAASGTPDRFRFPRPMLQQHPPEDTAYQFSFSGLKTAVLRAVQESGNLEHDRADIARGFQDAILDVLVGKTVIAAEATGYPTVVLGGGVACNRRLTDRMRHALPDRIRLAVASPRLNADNAAMIAAAGAWRLGCGERSDWEIEPLDRWPLAGGPEHPSPTLSREFPA